MEEPLPRFATPVGVSLGPRGEYRLADLPWSNLLWAPRVL